MHAPLQDVRSHVLLPNLDAIPATRCNRISSTEHPAKEEEDARTETVEVQALEKKLPVGSTITKL
jgi:hypothetical protein